MNGVRMGMRDLTRTAVVTFAALLVTSGCSGSSSEPSAASRPNTTSVVATTAAAASTLSTASAPPGRIVFRRYGDNAGTPAGLFIASPDGTGERRLTTAPAGAVDGAPDWSPNGRSVLFNRILDEGSTAEGHQLLQVHADGTGLVPLTTACPPGDVVCGFDDGGAYSPDGRMVAYAHGGGGVEHDQLRQFDIYITDVSGGKPRRVTHMPPFAGDVGGVRWSPNGKQLLFAVDQPSKPSGGRALFIVNADGTGMHRITPWALGAGGIPDWTAHGNLIVFRAVVDEESGKGNFFTIHPDGTGMTQVTHFEATTISHQVGFSPDGRWITFARRATADAGDVFIARVDGTDLRSVTATTLDDSSPDWAPGR